MIVPRTRTTRYGPSNFRVVAPQICMELTASHLKDVNNSREQLKLGLTSWPFVQAYSQEAPQNFV